MKTKDQPKVLVVEDDDATREMICERLHDRGLRAIHAATQTQAIKALTDKQGDIRVVLIDVALASKSGQRDSASIRAKQSGLRLARTIRQSFPSMRIIGMSQFKIEEVENWFLEYGSGFLPKSWLWGGAVDDFMDVVEKVARKFRYKRKPRCFIVHGRDSRTLHQLVNYLQANLRWPTPSILRDLPSDGRTIIEKFEEVAERVDIVFVLLTPDDKAALSSTPNDMKRRARQNVIFELGYF